MLASFLGSTEIDTSMVSEIVFSDVLSMAQTIGIIGTLALTFFFYKRHIQHLAMHNETETLRDLEDKIHRINIMSFEHPELTKVQTNRQLGLDTIYAFDVLNVYRRCMLHLGEWERLAAFANTNGLTGSSNKKINGEEMITHF
jgi:hypothetical protein